jgi:hypothetical protein
MKKIIIFAGLSLFGLNQSVADELNCPVVGGSTVAVTGEDSVSASCGINTDQSFLAPGVTAGVAISNGGSLTVGPTGNLANHGNLNTLAGGSLTNDGVLNNGADTPTYFSNQNGAPAGSMTNDGLLINNGELTNHNGFYVYDADVYLPESEIINSGSIVNNGLFSNGQSFQGFGCTFGCVAEYGGKLVNTGLISNKAGAVFKNYGSIDNYGSISNAAGGAFSNEGFGAGYIRNYGSIDNAGQMNLSGGGSIFGGTVTNLATGTITTDRPGNGITGLQADELVNDGVISNGSAVETNTISGAGDYTQTAGINRWTYAFGSIDQGSVSILGGNLLGDGTVTAGQVIIGESGRIEVGSGVEYFDAACWEGGYCDQATGIGQLDIIADVYMAGDLELRVGPDGSAVMVVEGALELDGAGLLLLEDLDSEGYYYDFSLVMGDTFDLVAASAIKGEFASVSLAALDEGLNWQTAYVTENGMDIFRATVVPIPAAAWLFGSGLGLLGWFRSRQTA